MKKVKMPVDIPAVLKAVTDTESAANTPISVSVYIDDTAPGDCVAHVRAAFASASANARVTVGYFDAEPVAVHKGDDMAVLVAGTSEHVGAQAARLRAAGVPVMVTTTMPQLVEDMAATFGSPIPQGDIVAPELGEQAAGVEGAAGFDAEGTAGVGVDSGTVGASARDFAGEPIALDAASAASLDRRMGEWVVTACAAKKLAFAMAFPFARRPLALDAVRSTSLQNAGIGAVMFIPGADMPVMTLNQMKMLLQIAAAYGCPMTIQRAKELAAVVGGAFACRTVAREVAGLVPGLGWAVKAAVGYAGTEAMGRAAIEYFEGGGDVAGLARVAQKARDGVVDAASAAAETPAGRKVVATAKQVAFDVIERVSAKV